VAVERVLALHEAFSILAEAVDRPAAAGPGAQIGERVGEQVGDARRDGQRLGPLLELVEPGLDLGDRVGELLVRPLELLVFLLQGMEQGTLAQERAGRGERNDRQDEEPDPDDDERFEGPRRTMMMVLLRFSTIRPTSSRRMCYTGAANARRCSVEC
jgi:hypothetical protein